MRKLGKFLLTLSMSLIIVYGAQRFCRAQTDGFALCKIRSTLPYEPMWEPSTSPEEEKARQILSKPLHYLGKGAQCYVFSSDDEEHVVKFFRIYHLRPPIWLKFAPNIFSLAQYKLDKVQQKDQELYTDFGSYKIAFDELKNETGLEYLHLNKTDAIHTTITLYDKIGVVHTLDADSMEFLIQKKAKPFYPELERLIDANRAKAKEALSQFVHILISRSVKGIFDKDPDINTNFGFIGDTPIQIDVGRFRRDPSRKDPSIYRDDLIKITDSLCQWLETKDPELALFLKEQIQQNNSNPST